MRTRYILLGLALAVAAPAAADEKPVLKKGDRLVIIGDSITEQKLYSRYMETYLTACHPELDLAILQLGWSGETAGGFLNRMDFDLFWFKPTVITTCYGMNDGSYRPFAKEIGDNYRRNMNQIIARAKAKGVFVVVGSPGAVDTKFFRRPTLTPAQYNDNLAHLRDIAKELAKQHGMAFANVHNAMFDPMPNAKKELGDNYAVCGNDGFHPGPNGQLLMAYAFLKALKVSGDIGTITLTADKVEASEGHKVLGSSSRGIEIESTRYPYCFSGDAKSADSPRSILPFVPFQQDLNRFTLVVKGIKADKMKVTWGGASKSFTAEQLDKGVNLAAEFETTPFAAAFQKVDAAVAAKQNFETPMIKRDHVALRGLQTEMKDDADATAAIKLLAEKLHARQQKLAAAVKAAVVPVKHTLKVEPE